MAKASSFKALSKNLRNEVDNKVGLIKPNDVIEAIPTGSVVLDMLSGINGIPVQRITQFASEPGVGKSTTGLTIAASCQRLGGKVLYLDFEQSMTAEYAQAMGCNLTDDTMIMCQPLDIDQAWELVSEVSEMGVNLIILDSIAAMFPKIDPDKAGDLIGQIGYQAKGLAQFFPRIKSQARYKNFAVVAINQVRAKIETNQFLAKFQKVAYNMELPGGWAPKFYTDLLYFLSLKKTEKTEGVNLEGKKEDQYTGTEISVAVWKNKVGIPHRKGTMYLEFGKGINDIRSVCDLAIKMGIVSAASNGRWSISSDGTYPGVPDGEVVIKGHGVENYLLTMQTQPEIFSYLRNRVLGATMTYEIMSSEEIQDASDITSHEGADTRAAFNNAPTPALSAPPIPEAALTPAPIPEAELVPLKARTKKEKN